MRRALSKKIQRGKFLLHKHAIDQGTGSKASSATAKMFTNKSLHIQAKAGEKYSRTVKQIKMFVCTVHISMCLLCSWDMQIYVCFMLSYALICLIYLYGSILFSYIIY